MDFRKLAASLLGIEVGVPLAELQDARNQLQQVRDQLAMKAADAEHLSGLLEYSTADSKKQAEKLAGVLNELNSIANDRNKLSVQLTELKKQVPEYETAITQKMIANAKVLDGYVFHTARENYVQGSFKAQHFDVRKFSFEGDWALKAVCQLIIDEYLPSTPEQAMLAVFKWQAKNVKYMTDDQKYREVDYWGLPHEALYTTSGFTIPADSTYYELLKNGTLTPWYNDDCETKSHLTKALCANMKYADVKLAIPDEWVWIAYGFYSGIGHAWVVYWDPTGQRFRIYEATSSVEMTQLSNGFERGTISYDEYFFNNSKYVCLNPGKAVLFG